MIVSPSSPATNAVAVTPSNTALIPPTKGVYVGTGGSLVVLMASGESATFVGLVAGSVYPFSVIRVATASTADDIVALY